MTTVQEIQRAVQHLPKPEMDYFRSWFLTFDQDIWDKQLEGDALNGKLDALADQALLDLKEGQCTEL